MRPGDVIDSSHVPGGRVFHAGIYMGDGRIVNSDCSGESIDSLTARHFGRLTWRMVRFVSPRAMNPRSRGASVLAIDSQSEGGGS